MESGLVRRKFLNFFKDKQHQIVPSAPIVNKDDPTLLFTNAGMNQFKDIFTGNKPVQVPRVANSQKCLRVSGKHNDLEEVGYDTYHHTMFEMLGNWSFGDYFRKEAIAWAWELITEVLGIDKDRLYVTIFEGDSSANLPPDEESAKEWAKVIPPDRILRYDRACNFWEMGETGPCGPCTEIHIDLRSNEQRTKIPGATLVNTGHWEVIEIWNIVLIQFNRKQDGSLEPLPMKSIDTGMGFERLCMVLQGKNSTYETDCFTPHLRFLEQQYGCLYGRTEMESVAMRVAVDHIRAITFSIADGQLPSNTGAGYVVRRLLRRASRYGFQYLNIKQPFLYKLVDGLTAQMGAFFSELVQQRDFIKQIIEQEEKGFIQKLERGTTMFAQYLATDPNRKVIEGRFAFELYDTYGFPLDLTALMAKENGLTVDNAEFDTLMAAQKERARTASKVETGDWVEVLAPIKTFEFIGWDKLESQSQIVKYRTVSGKRGNAFHIILDKTPFYAESGGQVGDTGYLFNGEERIRVLDTQKENELIVHLVDKLPEQAAGLWTAAVDTERRRLIRANHSATHLLHAALRQVLGTHVEQRGSLVNENYLRFDFSHFQKVTDDELTEIEQIVNRQIGRAIPLEEFRNTPIESAKTMGAMMLFGEKYGEVVRVIRFGDDFSTELCGGTHVQNTLEIRLFKITSEGSSAAGIRRIEAVTADAALKFYQHQLTLLEQLKTALKVPQNPLKALEELLERNKSNEAALEKLRTAQVMRIRDGLLEKRSIGVGYQYVAETVAVTTAEELKQLSFELKKAAPETVFVLGAITDDKPLLSVIMDEKLTGQLDAVKIIRQIATAIKGGGGGQPFYATAGGKDPNGLAQAIASAKALLAPKTA